MSDITDKIRTRGYWDVVISPTTFVQSRLEYSLLWPTVERSSVNLRGWDFPHIDSRTPPLNNTVWVGQESDWHQYKEAWRFYQSGQFVDLSGMWEDWLDESSLSRKPDGWQVGNLLGVTNTIHRFTEIYEFASKLLTATFPDEPAEITIRLIGLKGRRLHQEDLSRIPFRYERQTMMEEFPFSKVYPQVDVISNPRELALEPMAELFKRFEWTPGTDRLREWQSRIGKW